MKKEPTFGVVTSGWPIILDSIIWAVAILAVSWLTIPNDGESMVVCGVLTACWFASNSQFYVGGKCQKRDVTTSSVSKA